MPKVCTTPLFATFKISAYDSKKIICDIQLKIGFDSLNLQDYFALTEIKTFFRYIYGSKRKDYQKAAYSERHSQIDRQPMEKAGLCA